ncbi:hypothetical protein [Bdellovibrio sp. BCCA]|uniref:hypothetical protein n=1 Tax=Bdellovibrio sp. BCCA TaxID=3136281 RepID=UPI0030F1938B
MNFPDNESKRLLVREFFLMSGQLSDLIVEANSPSALENGINELRDKYPHFFKINKLPTITEDFNRLLKDESWKFERENQCLIAVSSYLGAIVLPFSLDPESQSFSKVKSAAISHAMNLPSNYLGILKANLSTRLDPVVPISFLDLIISETSDAEPPELMNIDQLKHYYDKVFLRDFREPLIEDGMTIDEFKSLRGYPTVRPRSFGDLPCIGVSVLGDEVLIRPDGKVSWKYGPPMSPLLFSEMYRAFLLGQDDVLEEDISTAPQE